MAPYVVDDLRFEVHTSRDGVCIRKADYPTRADALEAAGVNGG